MSLIQGAPLEINLQFVNAGSPPPPSDHPLSVAAIIRAAIETQLSPDDAQQLEDALRTPLDQTFADTWTSMLEDVRGMLTDIVRKADASAHDIQVTVPSSGALDAQVGAISSGMLETLPPGTDGVQLTLRFALQGFHIEFRKRIELPIQIIALPRWTDAVIDLDFDGEVQIFIAVPDSPLVPLGLKAQFTTHDMRTTAGNIVASLGQAFLFLSAWFAGHPPNPGPSDRTIDVIDKMAKLQAKFAGFSRAFRFAAGLGFLKLGARVATGGPRGDQVVFDLLHVLDDAPIVFDPLAPTPSLFGPVIGTSEPTVNPGDRLGVRGAFFPAVQSTELTIAWQDTTSGAVTQSEVQFGPSPDGQSPPPNPTDVKITRHGRYDNANRFTAKGLAPSTTFGFRVRDFDIAGVLATAWSPWTLMTTARTDQVELVLEPTSTVIGFGTLAPDGTFTTTAIIPASVPPGIYLLWAVLGGQKLARTGITVVLGAKPPVLQIINPLDGNPFRFPPLTYPRQEQRIRGSNFQPGNVNLFVDGPSGPRLGAANADANGTFEAKVEWPNGQLGAHDIVAAQGAAEARAPVNGALPPR